MDLASIIKNDSSFLLVFRMMSFGYILSTCRRSTSNSHGLGLWTSDIASLSGSVCGGAKAVSLPPSTAAWCSGWKCVLPRPLGARVAGGADVEVKEKKNRRQTKIIAEHSNYNNKQICKSVLEIQSLDLGLDWEKFLVLQGLYQLFSFTPAEFCQSQHLEAQDFFQDS